MIAEYRLLKDEFNKPELEIVKVIKKEIQFNEPDKIVKFMNDNYKMNKLFEEYIYLIGVNCNLNPVGIIEVAHGNTKNANVTLRQIYINLLAIGCDGFFMVHNHPSNVLEASEDDINVTHSIAFQAKFLDITFHDHIIITNNNYLSMKGKGLF